jgi:hypothetical protein
MFLAIERELARRVVHHRFDVDGAAPDGEQVAERLARLIQLQLDPLVAMSQQQRAAIFEVGVLDLDHGLPEVGHREEQLLLDHLELARLDLVAAGALVIMEGEELMTVAEVLREEGVNEADIVVDAPHLEDLFAAQP